MSLAITEQRQQQHRRRLGGCVGVFLQFLDWNRRFAKKKKLASKKLPPPVRAARRVSRKFGVDEKRPIAKLILIADENRGSFPSKKKMDMELEVGNGGMRAPGLVARLMGLESMPVVARGGPRKAMDSEDVRDLGSDAGSVEKTESRPPKLRKTGELLLQRQPAEHLQLVRQSAAERNAVPSRSSSKHRKLVPPVKSPRLLSGSSRARLMQAATKILEPGTQQRHHAKTSVSYVDSSLARVGTNAAAAADCSRKPDELMDGTSLRSCMNCGSLASSRAEDVQKSRFDPFFQTQVSVHKRLCENPERKYQSRNHQTDYEFKPSGHNHFKGHTSLRQNQTLLVREKVAGKMAYGTKVCIRKAVRQNDLEELRRCARSTGQVSHTCSTELGRIGWEKNMACKRKNMNQDSGVSASSYGSKGGFPNNQMTRGKYNRSGPRCDDSFSFAINSQLTNSAKSSSLNVELASKNRMLESMIPRGGRIRSLVEQRIGYDELETGHSASILEELITSLRNGAPPCTFVPSSIDESYHLLHDLSGSSNPKHHMSGVKKEPQRSAKSRTAVGVMPVENDQPSPVSILEASFSNGTCSYGSTRLCSGNQTQFGMPEKRHSDAQSMDMDIDHSDSATSETVQSDKEKVQHPTGSFLEAKKTISNPWVVDFALETFILDAMETAVRASPVSRNANLRYKNSKEMEQVRQCLFDCMFQSLASKYGHFCGAGWKDSSKGPFFQTPNRFCLVRGEVYEEILRWINLAGKMLDDLIEEEMSDANVMWRDREVEVFEEGVEIERQILETLVDEMVKDF